MAEYYVDIDMTICFTPEVDGLPDYKNSVPCVENINTVNQFFEEGHQIIYWTSRGAKTGIDWRDLTERQLQQWGCKYHELRLDKPYYDRLYDDKAQSLPEVTNGSEKTKS